MADLLIEFEFVLEVQVGSIALDSRRDCILENFVVGSSFVLELEMGHGLVEHILELRLDLDCVGLEMD